ncbi:MAG TPA: alpha/beta hydrolase [Polyangium sp.]|nr:alpha/beta hydrolase [Polyangium sp.]
MRSRVGPGNVSLVLTDGIACDGFIWKYLWEDLETVASVAHWNYRGHGRSSPPQDPTRIELVDHARDLDAIRHAIGDPPVVLVGHSMGCQVSLEAYRLRPEKVRGLVLICGAPGRITYTFKGTDVLARILPRLIERVDARPDLVRALWGRVPTDVTIRLAMMTGDLDRSIRYEDVMPYLEHMGDIDVAMFLRMLRSAGEHSAVDLLPQVDVPALVIGGDRDTFTPARYAEEMAKAMPQGELLMVQGGTHIVPLERRELVKERLLRFLYERVGI